MWLLLLSLLLLLSTSVKTVISAQDSITPWKIKQKSMGWGKEEEEKGEEEKEEEKGEEEGKEEDAKT